MFALALALLAADPTAPYVSKEGGFQLMFPSAPKEETTPDKRHGLSSESSGYLYLAAWWDETGPAKASLVSEAKRLAVKGKVSAKAEHRVEGMPGLELTVERDGGLMRALIFCSPTRCFELAVVGRGGSGFARASETFFNSFAKR
jgi:hypothetical protein